MSSETHGAIWWSELATRNPEEASIFCARIYGWDIEETEMHDGSIYRVCKQHGRPIAGIFDIANAPAMPQDLSPHWMTYIAVDDVDAAVAEVALAGGQIAQPPFDIPMVGRIAMIVDPTGATVGIITPAPPPPMAA